MSYENLLLKVGYSEFKPLKSVFNSFHIKFPRAENFIFQGQSKPKMAISAFNSEFNMAKFNH